MTTMLFNQYLAKLCLEKEMTQGDCAEKMGIRVSKWSHWYHGRLVPTEDELNRIFDILNLELSERNLLYKLYLQEVYEINAPVKLESFTVVDPERGSETLDTSGSSNVRALPQPNYWYVSYNITTKGAGIFRSAVFATDHLENFNIAKTRNLIAESASQVMCERILPVWVTIIFWQKIDFKQYNDLLYSQQEE